MYAVNACIILWQVTGPTPYRLDTVLIWQPIENAIAAHYDEVVFPFYLKRLDFWSRNQDITVTTKSFELGLCVPETSAYW